MLRGLESHPKSNSKTSGFRPTHRPIPAEAARLAEAGLIRLYDKLEAHVRGRPGSVPERHPLLQLAREIRPDPPA